ncbi:uncharacterized protein JCM15063_003559 [Sporobolomyces koalae]|uniref:uncharacterized protein n=1 Tax=Sporobolomyces koalae TaxID=500713 RepID=UPI0031709032
MAIKTVLVTGASGFLASYVIAELLSNDYTVHGTIRSLAKQDQIRAQHADADGRLKLFEVKDLVVGDGLEAAMTGCDAVLHTASPYQLSVQDPIKDFIEPAVEGTLTVLKTAHALGIKRVGITSSFAAVTNFEKGGPWRDYTYTEADWNPVTLEQATEPGRPGAFVYSASKTFADRAAHDFGTAHPDMVITTLNPPMIYSSPRQAITSKAEVNTSSNAIYSLINGEKDRDAPWNRLPLFCSTEDVALAHRRVLEVDEDKVRGRRFLLCGGSFTWEDAIRHLATTRPELKPRLPKLTQHDPDADKPIAKLDCTPAQQVLGITQFKEWKEILEKTIDRLVEIEQQFK